MPLRRSGKSLLVLALVAAALPVAVGAGTAPRRELSSPSLGDLRAFRIVDSSVVGTRRLSTWERDYTTPSGVVIHISVSDEYEVDEAEGQMWANYLDSLVHGSELGRVRVTFTTFRELQGICGPSAAACYSDEAGLIVVPGEDFPEGPTVEALLAHEYGHHVAASRRNPPWATSDYGTKRWATQLGVCPLSAAGELAPGNTTARYALNPGEIFAESYRVLNERRLGKAETPWEIVSDRYYPDDRSLQLLEQDVVSPWTTPTTVTVRGKGTRRVRFSTPLDGTLRAAVTAPKGTRYRVSQSQLTICGQRTVSLKVTRVRGKGGFTLRVTRP